MTRRLALTPAIGLFTGLSMVSFGAVSMWLTGVHGSPAGNPCTSKTATQPGRGPAQPLAYTAHGARAGHPAHLPIVLDAAAQRVSGPAATRSTSPSPSPKGSTPAPNPTPGSGGGGGISPGPGGSGPSPSSTSSAVVGPGQKAGGGGSSSVPGGSNKPPPTHGATPTPTSTPTPTPTPTSTATPPPGGTLCLSVQTLGGSSTVKEGTTVQFAIFVWVTAGKGSSAKLALTSSPKDIAPTFSVCATTGGTSCSISGLKAGQQVEVQAKLTAAKDRVGKNITLNVSGTSKQAINSATASDQIQVTSKSSSSPTPTPTPTDPGNNGGGTLPPANVPGVGGNNSFPGVNQPGNLGSAFPPVSPSPGVSPTTPGHHQGQHPLKAIDLSAGLPLDVRLIGGQVIGLAILAAAVTIAVARLSLRKQPGRHGDDDASTGSASASS